jgi:bilirubin oxidase
MLPLSFQLVLHVGYLSTFHAVGASAAQAAVPRRSPALLNSFTEPITIPKVKTPLASYINPETGIPIDFYELHVQQFGRKFYENLGNTTAIGYDGVFPGPTFRVQRGRETVVRVVNSAKRNVNFHLHGSYSMDNENRLRC